MFPVYDLLELVDKFATAATSDPLSAVLLAVGAVVMAFVVVVSGGFALWALADLLTPSPSRPPAARR